MAREYIKKSKAKREKFIYRIYDPAVDQAVQSVTVAGWQVQDRHQIKTSDSLKMTTFYTPKTIAGVYEDIIKNQKCIGDLKNRKKQLLKNFDKSQEVIDSYSPVLRTISKNSSIDTLAELEYALNSATETVERAKNWRIDVGQINFDNSAVSDSSRTHAKNKLVTAIKTDLKRRLVKDGFYREIDWTILDDFLRHARYSKNYTNAGYVVFHGARQGAALMSEIKKTGVRMSVVSITSYNPIIFLEDIRDINLIKLACSDVSVEKEHSLSRMTKKYQTISNQADNLIKKYCGF